ncbi:NAD-dependent deacetylase [Leucobacter komagatae]|uniref:protein acetyllysine N-acetyltransferase n=1 Tax=Leucobacter komagatae TaxID=55969 RepID=A0A0D0IS47_9MICO|nr:NAD-dependent deacetylase [Leucobacter komagatae]
MTDVNAQLLPGQLAELVTLFERGRVAVLTGAGMSTDSGIPDYRGAGTPPRTPMNIAQFTDDPHYRQRFWAGARIGENRMSVVEPNAGHRALARLEAAGHIDGVITQNVDGLHARGGARNVVELHGGGGIMRCIQCGERWTRTEVLGWFDTLNPGYAERNADAEIAPDGDALVSEVESVRVPLCPGCGGTLRPDVVYFGETVPLPVFAAAADIVERSSALLVAGSSLAVNTGMRLVHKTERQGNPLAVINRGPTAVDSRPSLAVRIDAGTSETLTALADALGA